MDDDEGPRPSCSCGSTRCIRRYCHCFGNRWYCSDACRCEACWNTESRAAFVEERAEIILKNKPGAFQSKIAREGDPSVPGKEQRRHVKGCTCRKSKCRKNYCECFKNRVACTERCQCEGCANSHGTKGDALLLQNNCDSGGTSDNSSGASDGGSGTSDGSNGTSGGTAEIIDEGLLSPAERVAENVPAFGEDFHVSQHVHAPGGSDLEALFKTHPDHDYFSQSFHTLMHQGSVKDLRHGSTNSTPQGLLKPYINNGRKDGPCGN